jgi:hypothetical protein
VAQELQGLVVGGPPAALWLWRLRATAEPDQGWGHTLTLAIAWAAWGLVAWFGVIFLYYVGFIAGAGFGWWECHDE